MTRFEEWDINGTVDVLVGGTPCQSFSIAGLRGGLEDGRGNLALTYCRILQKFKPRWFVWENVPGVLSSSGGRDFGSILGAMVELGYGISYRVLDAQYFGVPQRRRRVFVVGCAGDWQRAAKVLFESGCVSGNTAKGRKAKSAVAPLTATGVGTSTGNTSHCLNAGGMGRQDYETETMVAYNVHGEHSSAMTSNGIAEVAFPTKITRCVDTNGLYASSQGGTIAVGVATGVRRLTPRECERLQGFPDDWTMVPHRNKTAADGPRYKAIGNSMAVPVMRWIGERIAVEVNS